MAISVIIFPIAAPHAAAGPKKNENAIGIPTPTLPKSAYPSKKVNA